MLVAEMFPEDREGALAELPAGLVRLLPNKAESFEDGVEAHPADSVVPMCHFWPPSPVGIKNLEIFF